MGESGGTWEHSWLWIIQVFVWCMSQCLQVQMGSEINRLSCRSKFSQGWFSARPKHQNQDGLCHFGYAGFMCLFSLGWDIRGASFLCEHQRCLACVLDQEGLAVSQLNMKVVSLQIPALPSWILLGYLWCSRAGQWLLQTFTHIINNFQLFLRDDSERKNFLASPVKLLIRLFLSRQIILFLLRNTR